MRISVLKPGLLVHLATSVSGNVSYQRRDIIADHVTAEGTREAKWETDKHVQDAAEHEAAVKVQGKASTIIRSVCAIAGRALLCPLTDETNLLAAVTEARALCDAYNASASITRVSVNVWIGRIASDDVEAVRAINSEVRELLSEMESGLQGLDVKRVRDAADKAKQLGSMLDVTAAQRVQVAIDAARTMARRIVKAGESLSVEIDTSTLQTLKEARTAFLDLDDAKDVAMPQVTEARAIDLEPESPIASVVPGTPLFEV